MDLISKEKVFDIIESQMGTVDSWRILRELNKLRTVESRPKSKWIISQYPFCGEIRNYKCPVCEKSFSYHDDAEARPNFCMNCGADMRGEK